MENAAHRSGSIYRAILFSITILFALTLLADWFIPPYRATGTGMVFRSSYSLASALLVVALVSPFQADRGAGDRCAQC